MAAVHCETRRDDHDDDWTCALGAWCPWSSGKGGPARPGKEVTAERTVEITPCLRVLCPPQGLHHRLQAEASDHDASRCCGSRRRKSRGGPSPEGAPHGVSPDGD